MAEQKLQHPLLLPLHLIILFLSLLFPPFSHRRTLFIPLILLTFIPLCLRPISADSALSYGAATLWVYTLRVITLHTFSIPEHAFYRPAYEAPHAAASYPLTKKAQWVFQLLSSPRGIGWNYNLPTPPPLQSRRSYIRWALLRLVMIYMLVDAGQTWTSYRAGEFMRGSNPGKRVGDMVAVAINSWGFMEAQYLLLSCVAVGVCASAPEAWPPLFGRLRDCYKISHVWGRVWHQMLRGSFTPWGEAVGRALRLRKGEGAARAVCIAVAFLMSGMGHGMAVATVQSGVGWGAIRFFGIQVVGLAVEEVVLQRAWGRWMKLVGYFWVVGWFTYTAPIHVNEFLVIGLFDNDPVPWSPIRNLLLKQYL